MPDFVVKRIRTITEMANVSASDEDEAEEKAESVDDDEWVEQDRHISIGPALPAVFHEEEEDFSCE